MSRPPRPELTAAPELQAPRLATAWAALVYAVATMLLAYPALLGEFLVWPRSDQYIAGYAFREFAAASLKAGEGFPQWNPYLFGGLPYIAAMHGDIFYPTFLLRMLLPTDVAMTWGFIIHLFLAGLFTFGFLRAYGVGFCLARGRTGVHAERTRSPATRHPGMTESCSSARCFHSRSG